MNKKTLTVLGITVLIILLIISFGISPDKEKKTKKISEDPNVIMENANKESEEFKNSNEQKEFTEINVDTYLEYYSGQENKIILIGRPTCHYCQIAEPIISKLSYDFDIEINYLNTDNFSEEDGKKLLESNEFLKDGFGTPLLLIVSNNEIKDYQDGLTDYAHYKKLIKKNGFID